MFRDLGFVWYLTKDLLKFLAVIGWGVSVIAMHVAPAPYHWFFFAYGVAGFVVLLGPILKFGLQSHYETYRKKKEEAWDLLKERK